MRVERRIRWVGVPVCLLVGFFLPFIRHDFTLSHALGVGFFAYAALWFGVAGIFTIGAEVALLFDRSRRSSDWQAWYAMLSILFGCAFIFAALAWIWMVSRI